MTTASLSLTVRQVFGDNPQRFRDVIRWNWEDALFRPAWRCPPRYRNSPAGRLLLTARHVHPGLYAIHRANVTRR